MIRFAYVALLLITSAVADELPKEVIQLARIKRQAAEDLKRLPAFTCLANYSRYRQGEPGTPLHARDTVHVDVVYADHRERFGWPGSGKMDSTIGELTGMGLASDGEFVGFANSLFLNDNASAHFAGEEELRGRRVLRYDFRIPAMLSGYRLSFPEGAAVVALKGSFWADKETLNVARLRVEADDIPGFLKVTRAVTVIDYARTRLGSQTFTLFPQAASVTIGLEHETLQNEVEYTHCREFLATSRVSYSENADTIPTAGTKPLKLAPLELPVATKLRIRLTEPITAAQSLGDPVFGEVEGGKYAGASVVGRLRMLQSVDAQSTVVGIELTELVMNGGAAGRIFARATLLDPRFAGAKFWSAPTVSLPGVVFLLVPDTPNQLIPAGTWIEWRVIPMR